VTQGKHHKREKYRNFEEEYEAKEFQDQETWGGPKKREKDGHKREGEMGRKKLGAGTFQVSKKKNQKGNGGPRGDLLGKIQAM